MSARRNLLVGCVAALVAERVVRAMSPEEGHRWSADLFPPGEHPGVDDPATTRQQSRAELEAMAKWDPPTARMLGWWDAATPHARLCFVLMCKRVHEGMGIPEAGELFRLDVLDPTRPVTA